jgi:hypothetical protein
MIGVEQLVQQHRLLRRDDGCINRDTRDLGREMPAAIALSGPDPDRLALEERHDLGLRIAVDDDLDLMLQRGDDFLEIRLTLCGAGVDGDAAISESFRSARSRIACRAGPRLPRTRAGADRSVSCDAPDIAAFSRVLLRHWLWPGSIMPALREMPRDGRLIGKLPTHDPGE